MNDFIYQGAKTTQISFPLGGIGSRAVLVLLATTSLIDWEIFNRPNKGSVNGFSHFAVTPKRMVASSIRARAASWPGHAYQGELNGAHFTSYGWDRAVSI